MPLAEDILAAASAADLPSGGQGLIIGLDAVTTLSVRHGVPGHAVEAEALRHGVHPTRYLRNHQSITPDQQALLLDSSLAQVGLGGLGGTLLEVFLRSGIGSIRAADGDAFEESNLNRQALSTPGTMGIPKAEAARIKGAELNPSISLETRNEFLNAETLPDFLHGADVAIDALGGLAMRPALQAAAAQKGLPLVTGALAGWTGYVSVVMPGNPGPADIMGTDNGAEEILGCPAPAVTFIASLMANEAIKILTGTSPQAGPSMIVVDLQTLSFDHIRI